VGGGRRRLRAVRRSHSFPSLRQHLIPGTCLIARALRSVVCVCVASLYCRVRLLNYPSVVKSAPGYGHRGHASHIERVGFLAHDYRVISCGGADAATYQWRIRGPAKPPPPPTGLGLGAVLSAAGAAGKFKLQAAKRRASHWQWDATEAEEEAAVKIQAVVRGRNQRRADAAASVRCSDLLISFRFLSVRRRQTTCLHRVLRTEARWLCFLPRR
jgi:hypothetical protein